MSIFVYYIINLSWICNSFLRWATFQSALCKMKVHFLELLRMNSSIVSMYEGDSKQAPYHY